MLPKSDEHVNNELRAFLRHFESDRKIVIAQDSDAPGRVRDEHEKQMIVQERAKAIEESLEEYKQHVAAREEQKGEGEARSKRVLELIDEGRNEYKAKLQQVMGKRNQYRDMIALRKEKEKALTDILSADKVDFVALAKAIEEAKENLVKPEVVAKAEKQAEWLKFCKEVEQQLQQAVAEKSGDKLRELLARIEADNIIIEPKTLNDAKNALSKIK